MAQSIRIIKLLTTLGWSYIVALTFTLEQYAFYSVIMTLMAGIGSFSTLGSREFMQSQSMGDAHIHDLSCLLVINFFMSLFSACSGIFYLNQINQDSDLIILFALIINGIGSIHTTVIVFLDLTNRSTQTVKVELISYLLFLAIKIFLLINEYPIKIIIITTAIENLILLILLTQNSSLKNLSRSTSYITSRYTRLYTILMNYMRFMPYAFIAIAVNKIQVLLLSYSGTTQDIADYAFALKVANVMLTAAIIMLDIRISKIKSRQRIYTELLPFIIMAFVISISMFILYPYILFLIGLEKFQGSINTLFYILCANFCLLITSIEHRIALWNQNLKGLTYKTILVAATFYACYYFNIENISSENLAKCLFASTLMGLSYLLLRKRTSVK